MKNYTNLLFHRFLLAIGWKSKRYFGFLATHVRKWMMIRVGSEAPKGLRPFPLIRHIVLIGFQHEREYDFRIQRHKRRSIL
jgi:hypothetical protein